MSTSQENPDSDDAKAPDASNGPEENIDVQVVTLPENLDLVAVVTVAAELKEKSTAPGAVLIQADDVSRIGAAGAQLIYAFLKGSNEMNRTVEISDAQKRLQSTFKDLGFPQIDAGWSASA